MRYLDPPLAELLAADYVLGTLKGLARRRFEGLLHAHPALRAQVRAWESRLNRMAEAAPPVAPPPKIWRAIEERLFSGQPRWFERLSLWRNLALGSGLLAGALAILLWLGPVSEAPGYVVLINDATSNQPTWMVSAAPEMERFYVKNMRPMDMPKHIRCLLWLRPDGSDDYYLLGVLPDKGDAMTMEVSQDMRPMLPGQLLVTVEDMSGSPPAKPSSPPRYRGEWMPLKPV